MENDATAPENPGDEKNAIAKGYKRLSGHEMKEKLVGKQFIGGYLRGFRYIISIGFDGSLEGKNNYQHYDSGKWIIDLEDSTMEVVWLNGWDNTTTHLYEIGKEIIMYDKDTGKWRTSFYHEVDKVQDIEHFQF